MAKPEKYVFGPFVFEPAAGRLSKHGYRIKLQGKSAALLECLLERPGDVIPTAEFERRLWPEGTHVDFDLGVRVALNKLRDALCDSSNEPTYIKTIRGEGFRFIAPVEVIGKSVTPVAPPAELAIAPRVEPVWTRYRWLTGSLVMLMVLAAAFVWRVFRPKPIQFYTHDWVLVADFENETGEKLLDHVLEYSVQRELSDSGFVSVVPRARVNDILQLMKQPLDVKITPGLARQICVRDGEIKALITGRVQKVGTTYVLSADIVDPNNGVTVSTLSEEDSVETQLEAAARRLSNRVREELGERRESIQQSNERLEKVTTPSLEALRAFTAGMNLINRAISTSTGLDAQGDWVAGAALFEEATQRDPQFAFAHIFAAHCYSNLHQPEQAAPHYSDAFRLANTVTDRERLFILGSYYQRFRRDDEKAIQAYETLVRLYPDDYWAANNLKTLYAFGNGGLTRDRFWLLERLYQLRPSVAAGWVIYQYYKYQLHDLATAARLRQSALSRGTVGPPETVAGFDWEPAVDAWRAGDLAKADAWLTQITANSLASASFNGPRYALEVARANLLLGKLGAAARVCGAMSDYSWRELCLVHVDFARHDTHALRVRFNRILSARLAPTNYNSMAVLAAADNNFVREADALASSIAASESSELTPSARAAVLLMHRKTSASVELARSAYPNSAAELVNPLTEFIANRYVLSRALAANGDVDEAIHLLQRDTDRSVVNFLDMHMWIWCRAELASLLRVKGRTAEATQVEQEIGRDMARADADHPLLHLRSRSQ